MTSTKTERYKFVMLLEGAKLRSHLECRGWTFCGESTEGATSTKLSHLDRITCPTCAALHVHEPHKWGRDVR